MNKNGKMFEIFALHKFKLIKDLISFSREEMVNNLLNNRQEKYEKTQRRKVN